MNSPTAFNHLPRRRFLLTTASAMAVALTWDPVVSLCGAATLPNSRRLSLNGNWQVSQAGQDAWIPAQVPGCVHTDLLAAGKIPDPFYRDNEQAVQWVGESGWVYRRTFDVPAEVLDLQHVVLRCEGLDTLAVVKINGQEIGRADNMFRLWEFDAKPALRAGENEIVIAFASPLPLMRELEAKRKLPEWAGPHEPPGRAWVRKEPCNFGWDWGPVLVTCGIWRNIEILASDLPRLEDVLILQNHLAPNHVELQIQIATERAGAAPLHAAISVRQKNDRVATAEISLQNGQGQAVLPVKNAKLWWPAGMGAQPLYDVEVTLLDAAGAVLDRSLKRIGLRTLKLLPPEADKALRFEVNGVPFFAKGANWIPADTFATRVTPEILRRYVADAVAVNMNTLRFWGGGYYEEDALFDACDEAGICVWLDAKFACSSYPAFESSFLENVRAEIRDNVRRLRHHACIAVWCGNNEISLMTKPAWSAETMGRADYDKLFKDLIGGEVRALAPEANYVTGSPDCGDTHSWAVWHGNKPFESYRELSGFMSEFGFQSFPEPKTVRAYTDASDRGSVLSPVMRWHERNGDGKGCETIHDTLPLYFQPAKDFDNELWLSQIMQGFGIKMGAEHWRQTMPKSMGCVFWQYNDCWPVASWSSVDYFGRWKALHYLARRFYAPLLVSGLENPADNTIQIFVTSDELKARPGELSWRVTDLTGRTLTEGGMKLNLPAQTSQLAHTLELGSLAAQYGANNLLAWLKLETGGKIVSDNLVFLAKPKDLKLADPALTAEVIETDTGFRVKLTAARPALWAWLELEKADASYSDNFVSVAPGHPVEITAHPSSNAGKMSRDEFVKQLRIRSLYDIYSPGAG